MKRLLVTCEYPSIIGGQASYFKSLWSDLDPTQNRLCVPNNCKPYCDNIHTIKFFYAKVPLGENWLYRFFRLFILLLTLIRIHISYKPDEVHYGQLVVGGMCGLILKFIFKTPYVVHAHGADVMEFSKLKWARPFLHGILSQSKTIIANSQFTAHTIKSTYFSVMDIAVINPILDSRFYSHDPDQTDKILKDLNLSNKNILISVGRLVERKGHDYIIRSLPEVIKKVPDAHYLIVGDGPYRQCLENIARELGMNSHITFCGKVNDKLLPSYYQLASVFIMIPRLLESKGDVEGFGIVYLEANATGLPAIASKSGGVTDIVKHGLNGLVINNPADTDEISSAIIKLFRDNDYREKLSKQAIERTKLFSKEIIQEKWFNAISQ